MNLNNLIKNNLSQIQEEYLNLLKEIFGKYYFEYKNNNNYKIEELNLHDFLEIYLFNIEKIENFWKINSHIYEEIRKMKEEKIILTGELFYNKSNLFTKYAFSTETILYSDPCLKSYEIIESYLTHKDTNNLNHILINLILSILKAIDYLELNKSINKNVILFYPFRNHKNEKLENVSEIITLNKINSIYKKKYNTYEEAYQDIVTIDDITNLKRNILDENNLIYDIDGKNNINQCEKFILDFKNNKVAESVGESFLYGIETRTVQALDAIMIANELNSNNVMESLTSRKHLLWTLENIKNKSEIKEDFNFEAKRSLILNFNWCETLPNDILIELHKEGFMFEIQNLFNNTIEEIYKEKDINCKEKLIIEFQKKINDKINKLNNRFDLSYFFVSKKIVEMIIALKTDCTSLKVLGIVLDVADKFKSKSKEQEILTKFINLNNKK